VKLIFNRGDIGLDQVIEQAGLLRIQLLAALGKLQAQRAARLVGQVFDKPGSRLPECAGTERMQLKSLESILCQGLEPGAGPSKTYLSA